MIFKYIYNYMLNNLFYFIQQAFLVEIKKLGIYTRVLMGMKEVSS